MRIAAVAAVVALLAFTEAFVIPTASPRVSTNLFLFRQNYLVNLENLGQRGTINVNGKEVNPTDAADLIDQEIDAVEKDSVETQGRVDSLEKLISVTEQEKSKVQKRVSEQQSVGEDSQAREQKLQQQLDLLTAKAREQKLQQKLDLLTAKLEAERDHIKVNQHMSNNILATRVQLDQELGLLKKKYEADSQDWKARLEQEKQAHGRDVAEAQAEVERLKKELEMASEEASKVSGTFPKIKQSMKDLPNIKQSVKDIFKNLRRKK